RAIVLQYHSRSNQAGNGPANREDIPASDLHVRYIRRGCAVAVRHAAILGWCGGLRFHGNLISSSPGNRGLKDEDAGLRDRQVVAAIVFEHEPRSAQPNYRSPNRERPGGGSAATSASTTSSASS